MEMYIYLSIIVLSWSINPYFKKIVNKNLNPIEYNIYNNVVILFYLLSLFLYKSYNNENITLNALKKIDKNEIFYLFISALFTLLPSYFNTILTQNYKIPRLTTTIQSLTIIFNILIGYMFFNKTITNNTILGMGFSLLGIYLIE